MNSQSVCISVADIHGNKLQYSKLRDAVLKHNAKYVFMCGDLLPKDGGSWYPGNKVRTIQMQRKFIKEYFIDYLTDLGTIAKVFAIFGNDDFKANYSILANARIKNVHFFDNEVRQFDIGQQKMFVAGYPYIGVTPFLHKDWERWDDQLGNIEHKVHRSDGYVSDGEEHFKIDLKSRDESVRTDLERISSLSNPRDTIYIFHEAPFDTPLDMIAPGNKYIHEGQLHIGSKAMREFIEFHQPMLTMHGHIHETYDQSGDFMWKSKDSISLTAANDFSGETLSYVVFSIPLSRKKIRRLNI